jgi:hypothetical protein
VTWAPATVGVAVLPGVTAAEALVPAVVPACTDAALGQAVVIDEAHPVAYSSGAVERPRG